jgi:hypothetical protein
LEVCQQPIQVGRLAIGRFEYERHVLQSQSGVRPAVVVVASRERVQVPAQREASAGVDSLGNSTRLRERIRLQAGNQGQKAKASGQDWGHVGVMAHRHLLIGETHEDPTVL